MRDIHRGNVFDTQTLLDNLNDHTELSAFSGVARVWQGDGGSGGIIVFQYITGGYLDDGLISHDLQCGG